MTGEWIYNPKMTDFPPYQVEEVDVQTPKGTSKRKVVTTEKFLAISKCGKMVVTYMREVGQLCFFAKDELPVAWMRLPAVDQTQIEAKPA